MTKGSGRRAAMSPCDRRVLAALGAAAVVSLLPAAAMAAGPSGWRVQSSVSVPGRDVLLYSVAADGPRDAWTAGDALLGNVSQPVVFHWHAPRWSRVRLPASVLSVFGASQQFLVIGASSATNVWAFDTLGHWMRLSGGRWTAGRLPSATGGQAPAIHAALVLRSDDVWAFGSGAVPYAAHFDGRHWQTTQVPGTTGITDASAASPSDIWAVSEQDVLRWNGHRWRVFTQASRIAAGFVLLTSVSARSSSSVWVGGGAVNSAAGKTEAAAHWDGSSWSFAVLPAAATPAPFELTSMVPDGHGGLWGLGTSTSLGGWRLWHRAGTAWRAVSSPVSPPAGFSTLASNLAWQPGSASAWAAGWTGSSPQQKGMILLAGPVPG